MEVLIMHHVAIVLLLLWLLSHFNRCHPVAYFVSLMYLFLVHERYVMRLQKKLQYEEKKQANQKRVLSDSETVRWLNHAVVKIWPICMEQIASQKILLPIIPWFLEKYKPWTAKKASVQHMYLGRNPPLFTEMRVLQESTGDDHLVLELGMNFCTADDMNAILAVKLRNRLGFGMWAKLHMTGIHVEGKVLIGVKFLRQWPYLGRLRVCFAEPPYFQMTVKPIFTHGLDVTELPGIAGWLDKLLSVAFEQTLVQPNMLVVDMEKFASPKGETWFSVNEKDPVAHAKVEVVEASDMKPSDLNGLADPYVKGQLGPYKFRTKTQRKTLSPKWQEEFSIPIFTWESANMLDIEVRDKDHFVDDSLGNCAVNINDLKDGERHDLWLPLQNIKMGRLHLAITVLEENVKVGDNIFDGKTMNKEEMRESFASEMANMASFSSLSSEKSPRVPDNFEPINIEGQQETGVWVHHPGSEVSQKWEPRKGKGRRADTQVQGVLGDSFDSNLVAGSGPLSNDSSSGDEDVEGKNQVSKMRRGLNKISSVFHRNHKKEDNLGSNVETLRSPYANIRASNQKEISVKLIIEDSITEPSSGKDLKDINVSSDPKDINVSSGKDPKDINVSSEGSGPESPGKGNMKGMAMNILKHAEKSARNIKHALSRKGSRKFHTDSSAGMARDIIPEHDSSNDESLSSPRIQQASVVSSPKTSSPWIDDSDKPKDNAGQTGSTDPAINVEGQMNQLHIEGTETRNDADALSISNEHSNGLEQSSKSWLHEEDFEGEKK